MDIDFNKPAKCHFTNKPLNNKKIKVVDWLLKPTLQATASYCHATRQGTTDYTQQSNYYRVIGTELQIHNFFCYVLDNFGWQLHGTYPQKTTDEYVRMYKQNNNQPFTIKQI